MKEIGLVLLIPMILLTGFAENKKSHPEKTPLRIGSIIPKANVKMENYAGAIVNLKDAGRENGLLVIFSSNTCGTVIENHLRMLDISNYALDHKVGVIMLNSNEGNRYGSDSQQAMKTFADVQGFNWLYVIDKNSEIAEAFGATRNPECFLFNRFGRLVYHGSIDDSPHDESGVKREYVQTAIREIVEGKRVTVSETEPTGCPIRRK